MTIAESEFENEKELENWVITNIHDFLPGCIYIPGSMISTVAGKGGIPDGFAFNLTENEWFVIEAELLKHGVWPHIAEQIIRFVVATQNPSTRRILRDRLFEFLSSTDQIDKATTELDTILERLLQQIELFIEGLGNPPVKSYQVEVENSWQNRARRDPNEEVKVFRKPDRQYPERSRSRGSTGRSGPPAWI